MDKQYFHLTTDKEIPNLLEHTTLLNEVTMYSEKHYPHIPAFNLAVAVPSLDMTTLKKPKRVTADVAIGKVETSYIIFTVYTRYNTMFKFALPLDNFPSVIPVIAMAGEIRIAKNGAKLNSKSSKHSDVAAIPLRGEVFEVVNYGIRLFLDKIGVLKHPQSQAKEDNTVNPVKVE